MARCISIFSQCSTAFDQLKVHAFGWVIDPTNGENRMFCGSEAVTRMRSQGGADLKKQAKDYEHKLGYVCLLI